MTAFTHRSGLFREEQPHRPLSSSCFPQEDHHLSDFLSSALSTAVGSFERPPACDNTWALKTEPDYCSSSSGSSSGTTDGCLLRNAVQSMSGGNFMETPSLSRQATLDPYGQGGNYHPPDLAAVSEFMEQLERQRQNPHAERHCSDRIESTTLHPSFSSLEPPFVDPARNLRGSSPFFNEGSLGHPNYPRNDCPQRLDDWELEEASLVLASLLSCASEECGTPTIPPSFQRAKTEDAPGLFANSNPHDMCDSAPPLGFGASLSIEDLRLVARRLVMSQQGMGGEQAVPAAIPSDSVCWSHHSNTPPVRTMNTSPPCGRDAGNNSTVMAHWREKVASYHGDWRSKNGRPGDATPLECFLKCVPKRTKGSNPQRGRTLRRRIAEGRPSQRNGRSNSTGSSSITSNQSSPRYSVPGEVTYIEPACAALLPLLAPETLAPLHVVLPISLAYGKLLIASSHQGGSSSSPFPSFRDQVAHHYYFKKQFPSASHLFSRLHGLCNQSPAWLALDIGYIACREHQVAPVVDLFLDYFTEGFRKLAAARRRRCVKEQQQSGTRRTAAPAAENKELPALAAECQEDSALGPVRLRCSGLRLREDHGTGWFLYETPVEACSEKDSLNFKDVVHLVEGFNDVVRAARLCQNATMKPFMGNRFAIVILKQEGSGISAKQLEKMQDIRCEGIEVSEIRLVRHRVLDKFGNAMFERDPRFPDDNIFGRPIAHNKARRHARVVFSKAALPSTYVKASSEIRTRMFEFEGDSNTSDIDEVCS